MLGVVNLPSFLWFSLNKNSLKQTNKKHSRDFPRGPEVDSMLPMQGAQVPSLVRELRSHMLHGMAKNTVQIKKIKKF